MQAACAGVFAPGVACPGVGSVGLPCLTGTSWVRHLHLGVGNVWQDSAEQGFSLGPEP